MKTLKSQRGAGMGSILFNVVILMFIGFSGAKVAGFYLDNNFIRKSLEDMREIPYVTKKSKRAHRSFSFILLWCIMDLVWCKISMMGW